MQFQAAGAAEGRGEQFCALPCWEPSRFGGEHILCAPQDPFPRLSRNE